MSFIVSSKEDGKPLRIFYEDLGSGPVVVFIHGWPLNHKMWEYQMTPLREKGYRCIAYDRRGFGQSEQSLDGYGYNDLANDLHALLEALDVSGVTLVGFSMGGGEVVRYLTNHGAARVKKIVLISSVVPYMLQTSDNTEGVPQELFDGFEENIRKDRPAFLSMFAKIFYDVSLISHPVSNDILQWHQGLALNSSQKATLACMTSFSSTDFRNELRSIKVPTLLIHGTADKTVPIDVSSRKAAAMIPGAVLKEYEGAPHGLFITEMKKLNDDLADFLQQ